MSTPSEAISQPSESFASRVKEDWRQSTLSTQDLSSYLSSSR